MTWFFDKTLWIKVLFLIDINRFLYVFLNRFVRQ